MQEYSRKKGLERQQNPEPLGPTATLAHSCPFLPLFVGLGDSWLYGDPESPLLPLQTERIRESNTGGFCCAVLDKAMGFLGPLVPTVESSPGATQVLTSGSQMRVLGQTPTAGPSGVQEGQAVTWWSRRRDGSSPLLTFEPQTRH